MGKEEKEERKYVHKIEMGQNDEDLEEKKLLGSGGYAIAKLTENEEIAENVILVEKGEYKCRNCNNTIAQYRKFSK